MKIIVEEKKIKIIRTIDELAREIKSLKKIGFESYVTDNFLNLGMRMQVMRKRDLKYEFRENEYTFIDDINKFIYDDKTFNLAIFRAIRTEYEIPIVFNLKELFHFFKAFRIALKIKNFSKYKINIKELLREEGFIFEAPSLFFKEIELEAKYE